MKTIELSTGTLLVVDATRANVLDCMWQYHPCTILGHPSEITGEVWGRVCESYGVAGWKNYKFESQYEELLKETATQSAMSLLDAHNIQESDVLLFKHKNS